MIPKIIQPGATKFNEAAVALVPLHSRGVDAHWMEKRASHGVFDRELQKIADEGGVPGHTVLHVLIVGDSDAYGPNRNFDGFSREDNRTAHTGFKDNGHVFKHHKNDDPQKKTGSVLATAHNDDMSRIELLTALDNTKYAEELSAYERGHDIPWSMGSMQNYDVCSLCKHKAPTADDHCYHIQQKLGEVLDDGHVIHMENPKPKYFDASTVMKPADRIGYTLRKVAAENGVIGGHHLAEMMGVRPWGSIKQATLMRLASMEKQLSGLTTKNVSTAPAKLSDDTVKALKTACVRHGTDAVLTHLHSNGRLLSFDDFTQIIVGQNKLASAVDIDEDLLTNGFTRLASADDEIEDLDGSGQSSDINLDQYADSELERSASMKLAAVTGRVLRKTIIIPTVKTAAVSDPYKARGLADLYLHYKLAFANHPSNRDNSSTLQAVVLSHVLRTPF